MASFREKNNNNNQSYSNNQNFDIVKQNFGIFHNDQHHLADTDA